MSVVVIGDANVDLEIRLPTAGHRETHANPDPRMFGGGSAANTAAALARLGTPCRFAGTVGDDSHGRFAVASLREVGVDTDLMRHVPDEPTVMVMPIIPPDGERLIYVWPPSGGAHRDLRVPETTAAVVDADWVHVSGLCLRVTPARDALLAGMEAARNNGVPVSFDLNLRLENWGWDDGFRDVVEAAIERSDFVLGSARGEVMPLTGATDPSTGCQMLSDGQRTVIARLGKDGAIACSRGALSASPGFSVPVVDTVGAGDAFNAGFIAASLNGAGVGEALRWGNAVAALAIGRHGARNTPTRDQVTELLASQA